MIFFQNKNNSSSNKKSGLGIVFILFAFALILGLLFYFVYMRSQSQLAQDFKQMQKDGKTLTIEECAQKTIEWYQSCSALTQLCDQSITKMMRICIANGDKQSQCDQYGDSVLGYNFGAEECKPYYSDKALKKACADTYQAIADYCKVVRKFR